MIHDDIAYIHIPKTGGTSIEAYFNVFGEGRKDTGIKPNYNHFPDRRTLWGGPYTHMSAKNMRNFIDFDKFRVFSVVRNPYARVVSQAAWRHGKWHRKEKLLRCDFEMHVRCNGLRAQHKYLDDGVKIFKLEDGLDKILEWLELPGSFPHRMKSTHRPWQNYYNKRLADKVWAKFKQDFKGYGYDKDSWRYLHGYLPSEVRSTGVAGRRIDQEVC